MKNPFRFREPAVEERAVNAAAPMGGAGIITDPSAIPPFPGYGRQVAGIQVTAESALQVPAVFGAIRVICFVFGKMGNPYAAKQELSDDFVPYWVRLEDQPPILIDTFGGDAGGLMCYDGRNRTVASMALFGEAWWYTLESDRSGRPLSVEPLNPLWLEIKTDQGKTRYLYGVGSDQVELDPVKLRHIPLMATPGGLRGLSSIRYLGVMMGLALASLEFGSLFFSQGQSPSMILSTEQKVTEDNAQALIERFLVQHAGLSQSHLPLLLDQNIKATKLMSTPDESQFNQTLTAAYESIAGWFGVPPYLLGIMTERGNAYGSGATEEMMRRFTETCLSGYKTALEEVYSRMLPPDVCAHFDSSRLVQPDAQAAAMLVQARRQSQTWSINDLRTRVDGLPPVPGGDDVLAPLASNTAPGQTQDPPSAPKEGPPGPAGPTGASGKDGRDGSPGRDGPVGPRGLEGRSGKDGVPGAPGRDGKPGDPGLQGLRGATGATGATGPAGVEGRQGDPGAAGDAGPVGPTGRKGERGTPGVTGDAGPQGIEGRQGEIGPTGRQGKPGVEGRAGKDGTPGKDGLPGTPGAEGRQGKPGKDGRDADAREIALRLKDPILEDLRPQAATAAEEEARRLLPKMVRSEYLLRKMAEDDEHAS